MDDSWNDPRFAKDYMGNSNNVDTNWYEHYVNAPALNLLIPKDARRLLDFGCGPGEFTAKLKEQGHSVAGCDGSEAMIRLAQAEYPDIEFFVWDGVSAPSKPGVYDAIITKLALHFVEDLASLARNFAQALRPHGNVIVSVPHPMATVAKTDAGYFTQAHYDTEIGSYGMPVSMIHRSIQDYLTPFLANGYTMTAMSEPAIPAGIVKRYAVRAEYAAVPRRLNCVFTKV